jgi:segregation and condensation protein B
MSTVSKLESVLFVASKPVASKKLASMLKLNEIEILEALKDLQDKYNQPGSGIVILKNNDEWQMVASPDNREEAENFMKAEVSGELTRPQLETLTVISYCGPITKPELEQIRGVNCGLILRNLMLRGLVKENEDTSSLLPSYKTTMEYLRHMGIDRLEDLPDYAQLHNHPYITNLNNEQ